MSITLAIKVTPEITTLVQRLKNDLNSGIKAGMINLVAEIEARAVKKTPVKTSNLVNSVTSYITDNGLSATIKATAPYAKFVHDGTGIYGPHGKPIVPLKAKALKIPGIGYRRSVKGMKPRPFFQLAIDQINPQKSFEEGIRNYLTRRGL
jgi:HK97 gp10 family phage protein